MNVADIIERMKEVSDTRNDSELLKVLKLSSGTAAQWRKRSSVPPHQLKYFAEKYGVSVDYLLTGEGESERTERRVIEEGERKYQIILDSKAIRLLAAWIDCPEEMQDGVIAMVESTARAARKVNNAA